MTRTRTAVLFLVCAFISFSASATDCAGMLSNTDRNRELLYTNLYGVGLVTAWGLAKWDYFSRSMHANSEEWFGKDTKSGGVDKLGHLYSSYVFSHGLSYLYRKKCFNRHDAALYGAISSFVILGYMEVGDSFSDFGFSYEDLVFNALGSVAGYYLYRNPALSDKLDIRWEYGFDKESDDFVTDYENTKYILALKLNGFEYTRKTFLRHFELHLGYYTRGFSDINETNERNLYLGIGINLTDFFRQRSYNKTATVFKYFQLPGTYMEFERDLNK